MKAWERGERKRSVGHRGPQVTLGGCLQDWAGEGSGRSKGQKEPLEKWKDKDQRSTALKFRGRVDFKSHRKPVRRLKTEKRQQ